MNSESVGYLAFSLGMDQGSEVSLKVRLEWAVHLARANGLDILVFASRMGTENGIEEVTLDSSGTQGKGMEAISLRTFVESTPGLQAGRRPSEGEEATDLGRTYVRMKQTTASSWSSLRRLMLKELAQEKVRIFSAVKQQLMDMKDEEYARERRLFLQYIPCQLILCQGMVQVGSLSRLLVESSAGPDSNSALMLGYKLAAEAKCSMTALQVNPDVGPLSEEVGKKRLERNLERVFSGEVPEIQQRVEVANQSYDGVRRVWGEGGYDLVATGLSRKYIAGNLLSRYGKVPLVVVSAASPFSSTAKKILDESVQRVVPQITRKDRIDLVDRLQSSVSWDFDFITLMVLSTTIAAIGLLQNSTAVVIGAMLVAPLMTPLLGLGLALVQGNLMLARASIRSVLLGVFVSLLGGFVVGVVTLGYVEPTREMLARSQPTMLDLFVAYASGLAAAYASTRTNLIAALPGVAIAAALVPPIATSGLALALGHYHLALGSLLIFIINMLTIVLAAMTSLWAVGIRHRNNKHRWQILSGNALFVLLAMLCLYLTFKPKEVTLTQKVPAGLAQHIEESLGRDLHLASLAVAYDEMGVQLHVTVEGDKPVSEALATKVRIAASEHYNHPVRVRLLTQIDINSIPKNGEKPKPVKSE